MVLYTECPTGPRPETSETVASPLVRLPIEPRGHDGKVFKVYGKRERMFTGGLYK